MLLVKLVFKVLAKIAAAIIRVNVSDDLWVVIYRHLGGWTVAMLVCDWLVL
jgi:hypothetical protein